MHAVVLILGGLLMTAAAQPDPVKDPAPADGKAREKPGLPALGPVGAAKKEPDAKAPGEGAPKLAEHAAGLQGRWLLTLPRGFKYKAVLRRLDDTHFRLENAARFSGDYEVRDQRLILTKSAQPQDAGFAWEMRAPDELVLVAQPRSADYLGATLKQQDRGDPGPPAPPAERPAPPSVLKAAPKRPALDLAEHVGRLQGTWLLTLPAGFTYQAVLRRLDDTHFRLETPGKAVRFRGEYEVRDNGLVRIGPAEPAMDLGFTWQLVAPDELTLVAQPNVGSYLGATLKQQSAEVPAPKVAANPPAPAVEHAAPEAPAAGRSPYYLAIALAVSLACLAVAAGVWRLTRPRAAPAPGTITFECAACGKTLRVRSDRAGKRVKCPSCGERGTVTDPSETTG